MADPGVFNPNDPNGYVANDTKKFSEMKEALEKAPGRSQKFLLLVSYIRKGFDAKDAATAALLAGVTAAPESGLPAPVDNMIGVLLGKNWSKRATDARERKPRQPKPDEPTVLPVNVLKAIQAREKRTKRTKPI